MGNSLKHKFVLAAAAALGLSATACGSSAAEQRPDTTSAQPSGGQASCSSHSSGGEASCGGHGSGGATESTGDSAGGEASCGAGSCGNSTTGS